MSFAGKVLVTDDEAHVRKYVGLVLRQLGQPAILEANNGQEAVRLYAQENPDLVLLDVNMPVLDGVGALTQIKQHDPEALVIMLTSLVNRQTVEDCSRLGAVAYLRKDLPREEMARQLRQLIDECFGPDEPPAPSP